MKSTRGLRIFKYALYSVLLYLLYIIQTTPGLFSLWGIKPIWVVPFAVSIAIYEGEFAGGIYGAVAGLLCDLGGFTLFGFNGLVCCLCCIASGLLVIYLMRRNVAGCMLFVLFTMMLRGSIGYFFAYGLWDFDNSWKIFVYQTLPTTLYTVAITPPVYYGVRRLFKRFAEVL